MMTRTVFVFVQVVLIPLWFGFGQTVPQTPRRDAPTAPVVGTASISGVVLTTEATPVPVRRARVTARAEADPNGFSATTDDQGRFTIRDVPAGRYAVQATKPAWLSANYGAMRPGRPGTEVVIADGQRLQDVSIRMSRAGVITGRVSDQSGQPVPGVTVGASRYVFSEVTGERTLQRFSGTDTLTDDEGVYRMFGLVPGEYVVSAVLRAGAPTALMDLRRVTEEEVRQALADPRAGVAAPAPQSSTAGATPTLVGYAPVYFPGHVDLARASSITLAAAEERVGVNITLEPVPTARLDAAASVPDSVDSTSLQVFLLQQASAAGATGMTTGRRDASGRIVFGGVTPGAYTLIARAAARGGAPAAAPSGRGRGAAPALTFYASVDVTVDGRDVTVPLELREGMRVSGRIAFDDPAGAPPNAAVSVSLIPFKAGPALSVPAAPTDADGAFRFSGVPAGRYRLSYSAAKGLDGWTLTAAIARGRDVLDSLLDVQPDEDVADLTLRFTRQASELAGRLEAAGAPAPNYYIVVFSVDRGNWQAFSRRVRQTRPATDGSFAVRGLPAGEYFVAALTDLAPGESHDPAFLSELVPGAVKVAIREGTKTVQDLRIR